MTLCAYCGVQTTRTDAVCAHHACAFVDDWAIGNRVMCDFIHRGIVPPARDKETEIHARAAA